MPAELPVDRYERRAEWPLIVAAVLFLAAYALPILDPAMSAGPRAVLRAVTWVAWAAFLTDYLVRLYRPRAEILDGSWTFPVAEPD